MKLTIEGGSAEVLLPLFEAILVKYTLGRITNKKNTKSFLSSESHESYGTLTIS